MPTPQEALAAFLKSPGIRNSTANASGVNFTPPPSLEDSMVPGADSMEVRALQAEGQPGASMSRQAIRESGMAKVRALLKMQELEDTQAQSMAHIKGNYDVQGDVQGAQAAMDRVMAQQQGQNYRTGVQQEGMSGRTEMTTGTQRDIASGNQGVQRSKLNAGGIKAINAQIAAMEKESVKNEPGALMKMLGRSNPRAQAVQTAKQARDLALEIARDYADIDPEQALLQMGVTDYTPEELGQVQTYLGMIRGL